MVPILVIRRVVSPALVLIETPEKSVGEPFPSYLFHEGRNVLRHKECQLPCIAFHIVLVGSAAERVEVRKPFAGAVFHVAPAFVADDIFPPVTPFVEFFIYVIFPQCLGKLPDCPVVVRVFHRVGEAPFVIRHIVMLHVCLQVSVAGISLEHFLGWGCLHLHCGLKSLFCVKVPDAHLICAHNLRDFMFSDHYRYVVQSCRAFCKPSVGIVHCKLGFRPLAGPFRRDQIPELVEVPECVPEGVASEHYIRFRIVHPACFSVGGHPFPVDVTPDVAAADGPVHVVVETDFFKPVRRLYGDSSEEAVPSVQLVLHHCLEIPSERQRHFLLQIFRGIFHAYE